MRIALVAVYFVWVGHGHHAHRPGPPKPPPPPMLGAAAALESLYVQRPDLVARTGAPPLLESFRDGDCRKAWHFVVTDRARPSWWVGSSAWVSACTGELLDLRRIAIPSDPR